ncbi:MAG: glycine cleavage system protein H [Verrucomicrobia bacterium]|nr:glycine cleavage system protein H [Verrucomicrobiota bacterium]
MAPALEYRRAHFVAQLPRQHLYCASHAWLQRRGANRWRVGLTRFATRMLGEMADHGFTVARGAAVDIGQVIGWVEGFKAVADLHAVVEGRFQRGNPALQKRIGLVNDDPHGEGWLYEATGVPDPQSMDVEAYRHWLDQIIDRLLARDPKA